METNEDRVVVGIEVKGLSLRSGMEDRQKQGIMSHSAEVGSIAGPWMLIRWAQTRAEKEEEYGRKLGNFHL